MEEKIIDIVPDPYIKITKSGTKQIHNGNGLIFARYHKIPKNIKFKHKAINDKNQHLCGGWFVGDQIEYEEIKRVEQGLKPLGLCVVKNKKTAETLKKEYKEKGFLVTIRPNKVIKGEYDIIVSVNKTLKEYFDMETLINDYKKNKLYDEAEHLEACVKNNVHFLDLHEENSFDMMCNWAYPEICGLMFGYPIENRISRIKY
jgi:hypothetical protein